MKLDDTDEKTRAAIERVRAAVEEAVTSSDTPHTYGCSHSHLVEGSTLEEALGGGGVLALGKPPFDFDRRALTALHRDALAASSKTSAPIHDLIVRARRDSEDDPWSTEVVLVSQAEYDALKQARAPIDQAVEAELRSLLTGNAAWTMFGRQTRKAPRLARKTEAVEELAATGSLLEKLSAADELYRARGLELVTLVWTLSKDGLAIQEYFE